MRAISRILELHLPPLTAALIGALIGALVGGAITWGMRRHTAFTQAWQWETSGAALILLWSGIGVISGLTVLAPEEPGG